MDQDPWKSFITAAQSQHVRVVPSIMWNNPSAMHTILGNKTKRMAFIKNIVATVATTSVDGIDIDFEGKHAEDKDNFSAFLKELSKKLGSKKWLMCTIEARTPVGDRYPNGNAPADAEIYSNDFVQINKYCDRVRIMTYDQQGTDLKLVNAAASSSQIYAPVADPAWVEKVVNITAKQVSRKKIVIGVPTYGYEYSVTAYANNEYIYDILWTFNPRYALQVAAQYGVTPSRNSAGEMSFTYIPSSTSTVSSPTSTISFEPNALVASVAASTYATQNNSHTSFRLIDWPDAQSLADKIALAHKLGVRGVAIFKWDGGQDPSMWTVIHSARQ
jgi:spore germination protein YaaH